MKKLVLFIMIDLVMLAMGVWAITLPATGVAWIDYPPYVATVLISAMLFHDVFELRRYVRSNRSWS